MTGKIFKLAEQVIHKAQDDFALTKKHMPSQNMRALELTSAILALEVEGVKKCTVRKYCEFKERNNLCYHNITKCPFASPATMRDMVVR